MSIRKTITFAVPVALATILGANGASSALFFNNVDELLERTISGDTFEAHLAREYQALTEFEWAKMYDYTDAENHAIKGNLAASGKTPMPYDPATWNIESKAEMAELQDARTKLVSVLNNGARTGAPALAAKAQANYDCWVEQQEEGHQPTHIAACKEKFWESMTAVEAAMAPPPPPPAKPAQVVTTVSQEIAREIVYFDFDKAVIKPEEEAKIDRFVANMRKLEGIELAIGGHADTSGPADYNEKLSAARAQAVADKLVSEGMNVRDLDEMVVLAEGESKPAVITGDNVREARNRRVEIIAIGDAEVNQVVSSVDTR